MQAFVVQTHAHPAALPLSLSVERADAAHTQQTSAALSAPDAHKLACALCEALAASGSAALPDAANLANAETARTEAAALALAQAPHAHTHSWRSRAPPSRLSA